ncbi:tRNA 5-methylaminomethyl-2-thiouridine synthase [Bradyrhizobium sp. KB893862 SZCCT0404]|uniref:DUF6894 family protein n=1 Tax=Bradyrhizobium sp. KB893862 SZCCT0404 TaxID=2807672 RepID=UPI001BA6755C|nr:tRNA 5-methylaminomethyl-2-thiouridine synthase [Bradyrhizobium sp. KB893862 SZCCT0404]MBR1174359.1 tRNA 5-methylaminomethyl-2-thiouridine synthase [Bradyrhizobium sp. KB893862 SZCCT0404]
MVQYLFTISNGGDFSDTEDLPDDEAAWRQALQTVRDIETSLRSGGGRWSLVVAREQRPIYRIEVRADKLN